MLVGFKKCVERQVHRAHATCAGYTVRGAHKLHINCYKVLKATSSNLVIKVKGISTTPASSCDQSSCPPSSDEKDGTHTSCATIQTNPTGHRTVIHNTPTTVSSPRIHFLQTQQATSSLPYPLRTAYLLAIQAQWGEFVLALG